MSQPLYFLPNCTRAQLVTGTGLTRSLLAARGLADVFADVSAPSVDCAVCELGGRGPGDLAGTILCYQTPDGEIPGRVGFYRAEQTWTPVGDGSLLWIGTNPAAPPTAADMRRPRQFTGYKLTLADTHEWLVPVIRRIDGSTELGTDLIWDAAGRLIEPIKDRYRAYWEHSAEVLAWFTAEDGFNGAAFNKARALELAVEAVGLNYRYGRAEQNALRAIDGLNYLSVLMATIDWPKAAAIAEAEKKSDEPPEPPPPNSTPGQPAD